MRKFSKHFRIDKQKRGLENLQNNLDEQVAVSMGFITEQSGFTQAKVWIYHKGSQN
jgi:hypothetical protein